MMGMTCWNRERDKEYTVSHIAKIVAASIAVVAMIAIGSPASASPSIHVAGGLGCCTVFN